MFLIHRVSFFQLLSHIETHSFKTDLYVKKIEGKCRPRPGPRRIVWVKVISSATVDELLKENQGRKKHHKERRETKITMNFSVNNLEFIFISKCQYRIITWEILGKAKQQFHCLCNTIQSIYRQMASDGVMPSTSSSTPLLQLKTNWSPESEEGHFHK